MRSVPGRSRSTDTVLARYAQRVSNGIVLDIGVERGGKKGRTTASATARELLQMTRIEFAPPTRRSDFPRPALTDRGPFS
jgi:hypothetical protein